MARQKADMKCPYCGEVKAVSGMTSHVRHKHPEDYKEFQANRLALVDEYKIVEGKPTQPPSAPEPPAETPPAEPEVDTPAPEPEEPPRPDPKDQQSGSFLGSVGEALRNW